MCYNYWLAQSRIHEAVKFIQKLLNEEFEYTLSTSYQWQKSFEELVETIYFNDMITQAGLIRYKIISELNDFGFVEQLKLVEK